MAESSPSFDVTPLDTVGLEYKNIIKVREFSVKKKRTVYLSGPWRMRYSNSIAGNEVPRLCVLVDPCDCGEEEESYLSIFLMLLTCDISNVTVKYSFFILNANGEKTHISGSQIDTFEPGDAKGYARFVRRDVLLNEAYGLLSNDVLTIFYEASFVDDTIDNPEQMSRMKRIYRPDRQLYEDLGHLFENKKCGDLTLVAGGREFQAHKMCLTANSTVFAAMFDHEMLERRENRVDLNDIDPEVLEEMLRFIYTGEVTNLEKIAADLLVVADKYDIEILKDISWRALSRTLEIENAADILLLANLHSIDQLKPHVINFISTYKKNVMDTEAFHSIIHSHPHLFAEVIPVAMTDNPDALDDSSKSARSFLVEKVNGDLQANLRITSD